MRSKGNNMRRNEEDLHCGHTLSQFSSISIPPHSEKLMEQPSLSETIEK